MPFSDILSINLDIAQDIHVAWYVWPLGVPDDLFSSSH